MRENYSLILILISLLENGNDYVTAKLSDENVIKTNGTKITLHNIRKPIDKHKAMEIRQRLSEIYRKFTERDERPVKIYVAIDGQGYSELQCKILEDNGVLVSPRSIVRTEGGDKKYYLVGEDQRWYKELEFDISLDGKIYVVTGFIYQLNQGNVAENPGISVFRYNRLIIGLTNEKDQFKPRKIFLVHRINIRLKGYTAKLI